MRLEMGDRALVLWYDVVWCVHMCVYILTRISSCPSEGWNSVLILGKIYESPYHCSELEFSQKPAEAAGKPTKFRGRADPGNWKGIKCWSRWFSSLSPIHYPPNSFTSGSIAPVFPRKASKIPDRTRSSSLCFSGIENQTWFPNLVPSVEGS